MKILILDAHEGKFPTMMVLNSDLVIVKRKDDFDIIKSRHGSQYTKLPIKLLPSVIKYPKGKVKMDWENVDEITEEFDKLFTSQ